jgi:hypothetical protein
MLCSKILWISYKIKGMSPISSHTFHPHIPSIFHCIIAWYEPLTCLVLYLKDRQFHQHYFAALITWAGFSALHALSGLEPRWPILIPMAFSYLYLTSGNQSISSHASLPRIPSIWFLCLPLVCEAYLVRSLSKRPSAWPSSGLTLLLCYILFLTFCRVANLTHCPFHQSSCHELVSHPTWLFSFFHFLFQRKNMSCFQFWSHVDPIIMSSDSEVLNYSGIHEPQYFSAVLSLCVSRYPKYSYSIDIFMFV